MPYRWSGGVLMALALAACSQEGHEAGPASGAAATASDQALASASATGESSANTSATAGGAVASAGSKGKASNEDSQQQPADYGASRPAGKPARDVPVDGANGVRSSSAPLDSAAAERQLWLESSLYGGDNPMARPRKVGITARPGDAGYRVRIDNQMGFQCDLAFNSQGQPARLTRCVPQTPDKRGWSVVQKEVRLRCSTLATEVVCSGDYDMGMPAGGTFPGRMTIARKR